MAGLLIPRHWHHRNYIAGWFTFDREKEREREKRFTWWQYIMLGTEAPTMTVVWLCPASKQHLKGNKEWIELLKEKKWIVMENNSSSCFYNYTAGWTADSCGIHSVFFHCFYSNKIGFLAEEWTDRHDFVYLFWLLAGAGLSPQVRWVEV